MASHDKFKKKYELPFTLASDEDGKVTEAYGTWVEKSMYGRKYMGIERATFLIDEKGVIRNIWHKVKVPGHVDEVLEAAKALAAAAPGGWVHDRRIRPTRMTSLAIRQRAIRSWIASSKKRSKSGSFPGLATQWPQGDWNILSSACRIYLASMALSSGGK